jgi:TrmH family RNA methyltransferase
MQSDPAPTASAVISSQGNARVKAAARLRDRRARTTSGLTLVDGSREILAALAAGVTPTEVFLCFEQVRSPESLELLARLGTVRAPLRDVSPEILARLAFGDRSDGFVAVMPFPAQELDGLRLPAAPLILVAEGVEKPGNLGAIFRSADGAGADAVIAADPRTDLANPNAIRASLGTIFAVPFAAAPSEAVVAWLRARGIRIIVARPGADRTASATDLTGPLAIVVGAESEGVSDTWHAPDMEPVGIPMLGAADSLNVSVASAVLLYEARRQRGHDQPKPGRAARIRT